MAKVNVIMRLTEWQKYINGEESEGFSASMNPAGKLSIVIDEDELLTVAEHFASHSPYLIYSIKKNTPQ